MCRPAARYDPPMPAVTVARTDLGLSGARGCRLHARIFTALAAPPPRALLAVIPGISDHGERWAPYLEQALADGYAAAALDTRGNGRSDGPRGHVDAFEDYLDDIDLFLAALRANAPATPLFLFGHSLGGLMVLAWLSRGPDRREALAGALVQAPPLQLAMPIPGWKRRGVAIAARIVPALPLPNTDLRPSYLAKDPRVAAAYVADPLVHRKMSPRAYLEMTATAARVAANPVDYGVPTLFTHGDADEIAAVGGLESYVARSPLAVKPFGVFPGAGHEVHNEPGARADLWRAQREFMERCLGTRPAARPPVAARGGQASK